LVEIPDLVYGLDALKILETSLVLMEQGRPEFYRVAALQLRLLLCDTTRRHNRPVDISLVRRLWPALALHPLNRQGIFDPQLVPIPLETWLEQGLAGELGDSLSLRQLIRRVCDQQGGAHVDPKPAAGLQGVADVPGWIRKAGLEVCRALAELLNYPVSD
jgi:hypothetical protein